MSQGYIPPQDAQYAGGVYQTSPSQGDYEAGKPQNDEIERIDKGCLKFYQYLLIIVPVLGIGWAVSIPHIPYIAMYAYLLVYCVLQYQAVKAKDLAKVSQATQGLKIYVAVVAIASIATAIFYHDWMGAFIYGLVELAVFYVAILMGSMEGENILKKCANN